MRCIIQLLIEIRRCDHFLNDFYCFRPCVAFNVYKLPVPVQFFCIYHKQLPGAVKESEILTVFKQNGDALECGNYRGIKVQTTGNCTERI